MLHDLHANNAIFQKDGREITDLLQPNKTQVFVLPEDGAVRIM
jgi:hypothetical protein